MNKQNNIIIKSLEAGGLRISGYASVFNVVDSHEDIIEAGAFSNTIQNNKSVKLLWQHDTKNPIGRINKIIEDNYGLFIEAIITSGTNKGREAIDLVEKEIINGLSIGFTINNSYTKACGHRVITNISLWEVSIVTFPANQRASILQNHHKNLALYIALIEAKQRISLINQKS